MPKPRKATVELPPGTMAIRSIEQLSPRGQMDFRARQQILAAWRTKQRRIVIPNVRGATDFWSWYLATVSILKRGTPEIELVLSDEDPGPYERTKACVLAFSGGAESSLIKWMWPSIDAFHVGDLGSKHSLYTNPLEGGFAVIGAGLGYAVTFYGAEMAVGQELLDDDADDGVATLFEVGDEFAQRWMVYSGCQFLSPVASMDKLQVVERLVQAKVDYCSCIHSGTRYAWCRECRKCTEAYYLHLMLGLPPPFQRWKRHRPTGSTNNQPVRPDRNGDTTIPSPTRRTTTMTTERRQPDEPDYHDDAAYQDHLERLHIEEMERRAAEDNEIPFWVEMMHQEQLREQGNELPKGKFQTWLRRNPKWAEAFDRAATEEPYLENPDGSTRPMPADWSRHPIIPTRPTCPVNTVGPSNDGEQDDDLDALGRKFREGWRRYKGSKVENALLACDLGGWLEAAHEQCLREGIPWGEWKKANAADLSQSTEWRFRKVYRERSRLFAANNEPLDEVFIILHGRRSPKPVVENQGEAATAESHGETMAVVKLSEIEPTDIKPVEIVDAEIVDDDATNAAREGGEQHEPQVGIQEDGGKPKPRTNHPSGPNPTPLDDGRRLIMVTVTKEEYDQFWDWLNSLVTRRCLRATGSDRYHISEASILLDLLERAYEEECCHDKES